MLLRYLIKDKNKRQRYAHIGAAVAILIHSYDNYESGHHSYKLFAVAGLVFLAIALFHPILEKKLPWVDGVFFMIEGVLSLIVAFDLFSLGKKALPITFTALGIFQFFMAFRKGKKGIVAHKLNHQIL